MRGLSRFGLLIVVLAIGAAVAGCGSTASGPSAPADGSIAVDLTEWKVVTSSTSASAGSIKFAIANKGTQVHEFVVVKTDTKADKLPVVDNKIDESSLTAVDEVEDIAVGATAALPVNLTAGHYVLLCNIEAHYGQGMHADFDVK